MNERRWKVIKGCERFDVYEIITIKENDRTVDPLFWKEDKSDWFRKKLVNLVEIDADGNTIRTYKEGDTLDGGTLVQEEKMEGLDGVSMEIPMKCGDADCFECPMKEIDGASTDCVESIAAEVQRLRDKLASVHDVWEKARPDEAYAEINFFADRFSIASGGRHVERYTRTLPKTIEQGIAWKIVKTIVGMPTNTQLEKLAGIIASILETEYKSRTEDKQ
jgi:hypothetical protein